MQARQIVFRPRALIYFYQFVQCETQTRLSKHEGKDHLAAIQIALCVGVKTDFGLKKKRKRKRKKRKEKEKKEKEKKKAGV